MIVNNADKSDGNFKEGKERKREREKGRPPPSPHLAARDVSVDRHPSNVGGGLGGNTMQVARLGVGADRVVFGRVLLLGSR